jgi:hypothetical protein
MAAPADPSNAADRAAANEIARRYMSPRAIELDTMDRYVSGKQYDGRAADWFDTTVEVPILERRPCINYKVVATAIGCHVDFVLGEGRWPLMTSGTSEDDSDLDSEWGLGEEESEVLDGFVNSILVKFAKLKRVSREMLASAMGSRSVAVVLSVIRGHLVCKTIKSAWCVPTLDELGECIKLEVEYPYLDAYWNDQSRRWSTRCMLYRRVIDAVSDTTYVPWEAKADGRKPEWVVDKKKSRDHGLGFCPVIWYPFMKSASTADSVDGVAIHDDQTREIDCLNLTLSQKQRAALTSGDPQAYETGVGETENPAPSGPLTRGPQDPIAAVGADGKPVGTYLTQPPGPRFGPTGGARKRGAGIMWRYANANTKVDYLQLDSGSLASISDHAKDLRGKLAEAFWAVLIDPTELKTHASQSGKSLAFLFSRQTAFDDGIRDDVWDCGLCPLVSMLLRVVYVVGKSRPGALRIPGLKKILPILEGFEQDGADETGATNGTKLWMAPKLDAVWGPYFKPDEQDQLYATQTVATAKDAGLCTTQMGVEKLGQSGVFEVANAASVVDAITKEADEQARKRQDLLSESMGALNGGTKKPPKPGAGSLGNGAPPGKKGAKGANGRAGALT